MQKGKVVKFHDSDFVAAKNCHKYPSGTASKEGPPEPPVCVLVARKNGFVGIRDSKDPTKKTLIFSDAEFKAFANGIKKGEFRV